MFIYINIIWQKSISMNERYSQDENGQWWFKNYEGATKNSINGKLGGTGLIKAYLVVCLHCGVEFPRIKCHTKTNGKTFCSKLCANAYHEPIRTKQGDQHPSWKGGRRKDYRGYIRLWMPDHPNANSEGCVPEHRYVMEQIIGRFLLPNETVHHKNGKRDDNSPDNLELFASQHGKGQSVEDLIIHAKEILRLYEPSSLIE